MRPELLTLPIIDWPVKSYGAMLTVGFLTAVWLSIKRAERLKMDPDIVLNISMVCLACGVVFARVFYVVHYWSASFKDQPSPIMAALNFTSGGLEFYGGLIGAIVGAVGYMAIKRVSIRMYTDLLAPAAAWGLAFGRVGCLLNGCCWGGICVDPQGHNTVPWAIRFPHGSPAEVRQWENRQLTLPAELIFTRPGVAESFPVSARLLHRPIDKVLEPFRDVRDLQETIREAKAQSVDPSRIAAMQKELDRKKRELRRHEGELAPLLYARSFPSRADPARMATFTEIEDLMNRYRSVPVHPAQVYGVINALIISWVLLEILYRRKRHGVVFAWLCILYPITRIVLEMVRVDNPHDSAGLTISQAVSLGMITFGIIALLVLYRLPLRSPRAVPFVPPQDDQPPKHAPSTAHG